jgi:glutathione synthase/RimK-type ligase-like ATP-grasp enzyme
MGKKLYEKNELYRAIHSSSGWKSNVAAGASPSIVPTSPQMEEALARLRRYDQRNGKR